MVIQKQAQQEAPCVAICFVHNSAATIQSYGQLHAALSGLVHMVTDTAVQPGFCHVTHGQVSLQAVGYLQHNTDVVNKGGSSILLLFKVAYRMWIW
jgi:hypothetical protein